jgi:hypothetical protein
VLDVAYNIEYGLETKDQSILNMVDFITTDMSKPFSMFGPRMRSIVSRADRRRSLQRW